MHEDLHDKLLFALADVLDHLSNVTHVVDVLEFGRSWK
jgi:hypothetical protein